MNPLPFNLAINVNTFQLALRTLRIFCTRRWVRCRRVVTLFFFGSAAAAEFPVVPYISPAQLDCPWPQSSHYKQPWRGYNETRSGWDFLHGLGINLHLPEAHDELAIRLLAETGFRTFRIEVGWGESNWSGTGLVSEHKYRRRFELCAKYGIRPTILINADHARPCPIQFSKRQLLADAPRGATRLQLDDVLDLVIERSGLSELSEQWAAEALITATDCSTGEVTLSKPLPSPLKAGEIEIATLKYAPLHPVGTPEFEGTSRAWAAHAVNVCRIARDCGVKEFDLEIWNELTVGSRFLNINEYFHPALLKPNNQLDPFQPGGRCWELARRVTGAVKAEFPNARCLWGFSSARYFHCPIEKLPPGMDGQSYHPYGTAPWQFHARATRVDQPAIEQFVPDYQVHLPEGWAATFIQTDCLIRHLNPIDRVTRRPSGTTRFYHYLTEHGVLPSECGDDAEAWQLKAICATRSFLFWLNKGADALHYFTAFEGHPGGYGLLPANLASFSSQPNFAGLATPPMRALQNVVRTFDGSIPIAQTTPLQIEVTALGEQTVAFEGNPANPALWHRELFAALPFQIDDRRHVIAFYVMTRDATKRFAPQLFRMRITGTEGRTVSCYDPHEDRTLNVITQTVDDALEVTVFAGAHPRLLTISK